MIAFTAGSLRATLIAMNTLNVSEQKAARAAAASAGRLLFGKVRQNISLSDHSLSDLAALDHPYARRHGSIRLHERGSNSIANPAFRVHSQSGAMLQALRQGPTASGYGWRVEIDGNAAPHAKFVIYGTKVMLPRDVIHSTAEAPAVRKALFVDIVRTLGKRLRTQAAIRVVGV